MSKSKKFAIALLSTFGTSLLIGTPLIILSSTHKKYPSNTNNQISKESRYRLANWINKYNKESELLSYFFTSQEIVKNSLQFKYESINKYKIKRYFKKLLFDIFKYSQEENELNLKIEYKINEIRNKCTLNLNWYFINQKHNIIVKNTKYYDILMLYF